MANEQASVALSERARARLRDEEIIWLTTVRKDGQPQPVPVWFLWEDGGDTHTLLIYSRPNQQKLRNVRAHPQVALNFNTDAHGNDVAWFEGRAEIVAGERPATENAAYVEKYRAGIGRIGMTAQNFAGDYSIAIRVRLTRSH